MSKVGKKTLVEHSTWDERGRVRPLGLLCGQKSHFHHVPKDSASCHPSIIWICTAPGRSPRHPQCWQGAKRLWTDRSYALWVLKASKSGSRASSRSWGKPLLYLDFLNSQASAASIMSGGLSLQWLGAGFRVPTRACSRSVQGECWVRAITPPGTRDQVCPLGCVEMNFLIEMKLVKCLLGGKRVPM